MIILGTICEDINTFPGTQRGLKMTLEVNRYCTLYIWFGTLVKQRAAFKFLLFQYLPLNPPSCAFFFRNSYDLPQHVFLEEGVEFASAKKVKKLWKAFLLAHSPPNKACCQLVKVSLPNYPLLGHNGKGHCLTQATLDPKHSFPDNWPLHQRATVSKEVLDTWLNMADPLYTSFKSFVHLENSTTLAEHWQELMSFLIKFGLFLISVCVLL